MKTRYRWIAFSIAAFTATAPANAADPVTISRSRNVVMVSPSVSPPIARLADQELGYSVLHDTGVLSRGYRVHLTCSLDDSFVQTFCPTKQYFASCPRAKIACR